MRKESQGRIVWSWAPLTRSSYLSQNGDYNKPIPAQYMEHLNHVVSSVPSPRDPAQPQQWVSSQVLLCRRCSHHQTTKIKQLAAFTPREEVSMYGQVEPDLWLAVHFLLPHIPRCVAPFSAGAELVLTVVLWSLGEHHGNQGLPGQRGLSLRRGR